nr:nucleotide disphospho-sugar-binding domain-containing protein [Streptomyces boncukensis]
MFTTLPGTSHMLPLVPLAHAALADGHDVAVVSSGPGLETAAAAGLQTLAPDDGDSARPYQELGRRVNETSLTRDLTDPELIAHFGSVFAEIGTLMMDGLLEAARSWRADTVVYTAPHPAGLVAARALGLPAVLHGIGTRRPTFGPALEGLAPTARKLDVDEVREADVQLVLAPPSLETILQDGPQRESAAHTLPMRYVPYNGAGELPRDLLRRGERPRLVATLGSIPASYGEGRLLHGLVEGTAGLDVELLLAAGTAQLSALPDPLPGHVRLLDWVPLRTLLETCDGIVHHGGMGTMYAAFSAGVPQLALTHEGTDSAANARISRTRGTGPLLEMDRATAGTVAAAVRDLLGNAGYRRASEEVAREMRTMPTPRTVVPRLTRLLEAQAAEAAEAGSAA